MIEDARNARAALSRAPAWTRTIVVLGPGLLVMLADTDAGNVVTAAQAGANWGYRLAPLVLALAPVLYLVQDVSLRLGLHARAGLGALIRRHCGPWGAGLAALALGAATLSSLTTEFSGVAGVGELWGVSRSYSVPAAALALMGVVLAGEYRRAERIALALGLCEAAFLFVAWRAHPAPGIVARQAIDWPVGNAKFNYLVAALIGASFNPWMLFYQSSAVAAKKLMPEDYPAARAETMAGALITQALTAAVLVSIAALNNGVGAKPLADIGEISAALTPWRGEMTGRFVFGVGVVGASMAAAIVATLACAWGRAELLALDPIAEGATLRRPGFLSIYVIAILVSSALALGVGDLVSLSVAMQAINAALLPAVGALLIFVGVKALPAPFALTPLRRVALVALLAIVSAAGWIGVAGGFVDLGRL